MDSERYWSLKSRIYVSQIVIEISNNPFAERNKVFYTSPKNQLSVVCAESCSHSSTFLEKVTVSLCDENDTSLLPLVWTDKINGETESSCHIHN